MSKSSARPITDPEFSQDSLQQRWKKCLELIKDEISPQGFRTWLSPIIPVSFVDEILILRVPSQFFFEWLETHYQDKVLEAVKKIYGLRTKIEYLVASTPDKPIAALSDFQAPDDQIAEKNVQTDDSDQNLDSRYHFENFIVKNDNELALRAAQTVAKNPGKTDFNPLFIYGSSGCGKTHLLYAIGNNINENKKRKKIQYLSSENFLNEYISALQSKKLDLLNNNFQKNDILLIDDIQFLSNKKKSQEGLYFFFAEMERKRKQIVISADQAPGQLIGFDPRLLSFFQKGLIIDLIPPSYETRLQWINSFCEKTNLMILPEVKDFLSHSIFDGLQQMRAIMVRIAAQSSLIGKPVSIANIKRILTQIDVSWAKKNSSFHLLQPVKIEKIIKSVSEYLNIPVDILTGYSRQREVTFARQIAIFLSKELTGESLKSIGYHYSDRHYTAILHSYRKIQKEMKNNPAIRNLIIDIKNQLSSK